MDDLDDWAPFVIRAWIMRAWSVVGCVVVLGGAVALASESGEPVCLADTQRFCTMVPVGLVQACLQAHRGEVSAECRKHVSEVNDDIDRLGRDCESDLARLCAERQTAAGQRVSCLAMHRDALSPGCRDTLDDVSTK